MPTTYKQRFISLLDDLRTQYGIIGVLELSTGTGMTDKGLANVEYLSEGDCENLLQTTISQWLCNVRSDRKDLLFKVQNPDYPEEPVAKDFSRFCQFTIEQICEKALKPDPVIFDNEYDPIPGFEVCKQHNYQFMSGRLLRCVAMTVLSLKGR